ASPQPQHLVGKPKWLTISILGNPERALALMALRAPISPAPIEPNPLAARLKAQKGCGCDARLRSCAGRVSRSAGQERLPRGGRAAGRAVVAEAAGVRWAHAWGGGAGTRRGSGHLGKRVARARPAGRSRSFRALALRHRRAQVHGRVAGEISPQA